ncbi:MAG TPA: Ig-like domain-containing protein [Jatrophihabitans sp.]|jgi:hypothetical protein|nr:Ig-like domain-containing protein [Jatrophihabitans sp.]
MSLLRRRILVPVAAIAVVLAGAGISWAFWTTSGTGTASGTTGTLYAPTDVTASGGGGSTVSLSWTASASSPSAPTPTGYYVARVSGDTSSAACGGTTITGTSCADTSVPDGTYQYIVTAVYHSWTAASGPSNSIDVTSRRPAVTVARASGQGASTNNPLINFTATFDEPVTGLTSSGVVVGGTASGFSVTVTGSGTTYNIAVSGMSGSGTVTVAVAENAANDAKNAGNTASNTASVTFDVTHPVAATPNLSAPTKYGTDPVYVNDETVTFSSASSDADSGVASVSYYYCAGATGSCSSANGISVGTSTAAGDYPVTLSTAGLADQTYRVVAIVADNAGNTTTSAALTFAVDTTVPTLGRPIVNGHS